MLAADAFSDAAYALLNERVTFNQDHFYIFRDADSGFNHGTPSNHFAEPQSLTGQLGSIWLASTI